MLLYWEKYSHIVMKYWRHADILEIILMNLQRIIYFQMHAVCVSCK